MSFNYLKKKERVFFVFFDLSLSPMSVRAILAVALIASVALAGAPTFTFCGGSIANPSATSPDSNWKGGSSVSFVLSGDVTETIEEGSTVTNTVKFSGSLVEEKTEDLCTYAGTPFTCPTEPGQTSWNFPLTIPSIPFSGKLTTHSEFYNYDGSLLLCFDLSVQL